MQYSSIYKYIREDFNPFSLIKEASYPDFIIDVCNEYIEGKSNFKANGYSGFRFTMIEEIVKNSDSFSLINPNNANFKITEDV